MGTFAGISLVHVLLAARWPTAPGVVTVSRIFRDHEFQTRFGLGHGLLAEVRYRYGVNGDEFESSRVRFKPDQIGGRAWSYSPEIGRQYAVGQKVNVRFDPDNPANAVLKTQVTLPMVICLAVACGALCFSLVCHRLAGLGRRRERGYDSEPNS